MAHTRIPKHATPEPEGMQSHYIATTERAPRVEQNADPAAFIAS